MGDWFHVWLFMHSIPLLGLDVKRDRVEFFDGKFIVWSKCSSIYSTNVIGIHEKRLYTLETTYSSICT